MEYQLTKIAKSIIYAKIHHSGHGEVVSAVSPLLASTGLLCLASLVPGSQAHARLTVLTRLRETTECAR